MVFSSSDWAYQPVKSCHVGNQFDDLWELPQISLYAGIATSPYGTLPVAPNVSGADGAIPELRTGLSSRPPAYLSQRAVSLLSAKPITPRPLASQIRAASSRNRMRRSASSFPPHTSLSCTLLAPLTDLRFVLQNLIVLHI